MKIKNNSAAFEIRYDSQDYEILKGEMEISDDAFGTFILATARKWGLDVVKTESTKKGAIEPISVVEEVVEETVEEVTEEVVEAVVEEAPKEKKKK